MQNEHNKRIHDKPQHRRAYARYEVKEGDMVYPIYNDNDMGGPNYRRYPAGILLRIEDSGGGPDVCPYVQFHLFVDGRVEVYDEPHRSIQKVDPPQEEA